ncbi:MAG: hypothetical protein AM325_016405 [Candidatus Thorarchaeota archaeon SMTZ1-45]
MAKKMGKDYKYWKAGARYGYGAIDEYDETGSLNRTVIASQEEDWQIGVAQMNITSMRVKGRTPTNAEKSKVVSDLNRSLRAKGYDFNTWTPTGTSIDLRNFRLSDEYVKKYGYNISPYSQRRGRILGWMNWVEVNNTVNAVLDKHKVSANAKTLGGKFKIRRGFKKFTKDDWEEFAYENVGSIMEPVMRKDAWRPELPIARKKLEMIS